jgi:hypothetical protein
MPTKNSTTKKTARKPTARKIRKTGYQRLIDEEEDLIAKQLAPQKKGCEQTQAALTSLLIELSNVTGVDILDEQIVRIFFQRAAKVAEKTYDPKDRHAMFNVLTDISRLLGTTSTEVFSTETLAFVNRHSRFPHYGEPLDLDESESVIDDAEANTLIDGIRGKLDRLERLPENEAERFRLETEIYGLENESDEWPDVIGAEAGDVK